MSEAIFAIGLATGFIMGIFVGWMNARDKYKLDALLNQHERLIKQIKLILLKRRFIRNE